MKTNSWIIAWAVAVSLLAGTAPAAAEKPDLTALAFNVEYDSDEPAKSIAAIEKADADVVCLSEVRPAFYARLLEKVGKRYPYRSMQTASGTWGIGILSRFPLADGKLFEEKPHKIPAMEARVQTPPQGPVRVACLHLFPPVGKHRKSDGFFETMEKNAQLRVAQAKALIARYATEPSPVLLMGDMNEGPDGEAMKALSQAGYAFACAAPHSECGNTWPGGNSAWPAVSEIDRILGRRLSFSSARVVKGGGSDHFPVWAAFRVAPPAPPAAAGNGR